MRVTDILRRLNEAGATMSLGQLDGLCVRSAPDDVAPYLAVPQVLDMLQAAYLGAFTKHAWAECPVCHRCQMVPTSSPKHKELVGYLARTCRMTTGCNGAMMAPVEVPGAEDIRKRVKAARKAARKAAKDNEPLEVPTCSTTATC